jgi:hypothetical protein
MSNRSYLDSVHKWESFTRNMYDGKRDTGTLFDASAMAELTQH